MKVYLVYYDQDGGSREDWNVFYTPCEIYLDKALFYARVKHLKTTLPSNYEVHTEDTVVSTNTTQQPNI